MRRALAALVVTAVAVVLLARYETQPPRTLNPNSALRPAAAAPAPRATPRPGEKSASGPVITTPFSVIQVRATLTRGRLTGVETRRAHRRRAAHATRSTRAPSRSCARRR